MTDKPDGKRWRRVTRAWIAIGVLVLYLLSFIPVCLICAWLVQWHVIPRGPADSAAGVVYAPIFCVLGRSPVAEARDEVCDGRGSSIGTAAQLG